MGDPRVDRLTHISGVIIPSIEAAVMREDSYGDDLGHVVMLDPEGDEFYVA
jgi:hypothetical protein